MIYDRTDIRYLVQQKIGEMYANERLVKITGSLFDPLIEQFETQNVCNRVSLYQGYTSAKFSESECSSLQNRVLTEGVRSSIGTANDLSQAIYTPVVEN